MLVKEINKLTTEGEVMYHKKWDCNVRVVLKLYSYLCDRPDKGKRLQMLTGAPYCQRFGYTANLPSCINEVVCCRDCVKKLMDDLPLCSEEGERECKKCFAFDSRHISYKMPADYPKREISDSVDGKLRMKKVSFRTMKEAVKKSFENAVQKKWSRKKMDKYLQVEGVSTCLRNKIWNNAVWNDTRSKNESDNDSYMEDQERDHPEKFDLPSTPPLWELKGPMRTDMFVDAPMHLLFLGTHKALCKDFLSRWLVGEKKLSSYSMGLNDKLKLVNSLKLSWMDVLPTAGSDEKKMTYGGWLSRNMIAHCRLSMWLHSHLPFCKESEDGPHAPVHNNYETYTNKEIMGWFADRMIPADLAPTDSLHKLRWWFEHMRRSPEKCFQHYDEDDILEYIHNHTTDTELMQSLELPQEERRSVFFDYVVRKECLPPVVRTTKHNPNNENDMGGGMIDLIRTHQCMVARVMGGASGASVGRHAKIFLTKMHRMDKEMRGFAVNRKVKEKDAHKLELVSRQNYMTLLNMEHAIDHYGPLRLLWEGGRMGKLHKVLLLLQVFFFDLISGRNSGN